LQAERYLNASNGDLTLAASLFFDEHQEQAGADSDRDVDMAEDDQTNAPPQSAQQPVPGGGRTLDGSYAPPPAGASSSSSSQPSSSRQAPRPRGVAGARTLKDLQSGGAGGHAHSDGDSDDDHDEENQDFFTGGEKSGLAVQNPNAANPRDQINNILKRARQ